MLKDFQMDKIYFIRNLVNLWCKVQGDSTHGEITFSEFFSSKQLFTGVLPCSFAENFHDEKFSLVNSYSKKKKILENYFSRSQTCNKLADWGMK